MNCLSPGERGKPGVYRAGEWGIGNRDDDVDIFLF